MAASAVGRGCSGVAVGSSLEARPTLVVTRSEMAARGGAVPYPSRDARDGSGLAVWEWAAVAGVDEGFVEGDDEVVVVGVPERVLPAELAADPFGVVVAADTDVAHPQVVVAESGAVGERCRGR